MSVFTVISEGCYDSQLPWPFKGTVIYKLLNQLADDRHHHVVNVFTSLMTCRLIAVKVVHNFFLTLLSALTQLPTHSTSWMIHCTSECQ